MTYRIAKLVSDYVSPGVYVNRLELGDSGFNGPVDLRFIGDPGWIENAHSVFFGVNGRDAYYPTNTGGLITTSDTGDLVFFDPSNDVGRTLTQLYGGGLWEVDGSYSQLITARPIDMQGQEIIKALNVKGSLNADFSLYGSNAADTDWIEFLKWDHANEKIILSNDLDMANHDVIGTKVVKAYSTNNLSFWDNANGTKTLSDLVAGSGLWEVDGSYSQLITARPIDMQGQEIIKALNVKGSLNADFSLYGSNAADTDWIEFLEWNHATENLTVKVTAGNYISMDVGGSTKLQADEDGIYIGGHLEMGFVEIYNTEYLHFHNRTSDPSSPSAGTIYYNSSSNKIKMYNGSSWETVSSS